MKPINFSFNINLLLITLRTNFLILFRRKSIWISLFLFSLVLLTVFPFALGTEALKDFKIQIGSYWIIQEFVISLVVLNMFKVETESGVLEIYSSTRGSKLFVFLGKTIFTWLHIVSLQFPLFFLWILIFNPSIETLSVLWPTLLISSSLFALTASLLGSFLFFVTRKSLLKEVLQPLLFFPLQSASLLAAVGVCLITQNAENMLSWSAWWNVLLAYPLLLIGFTLLLGDTLLEE